MKNFYEATIIRQNLSRQVELELSPLHGCPYARVEVDDCVLFEDLVKKDLFLKKTLPLRKELEIKIFVQRTHPEAVIIKNIAVDSKTIMPLHQSYCSPPTCYLDFNGAWQIKFDDYVRWYHKVSGQGWIA